MKAIIISVMFFVLIGCATTSTVYPPNKTDADWVKDEACCAEKSGRISGAWSASIIGVVANASASKEYNDCMKEKGWLK